MHTGILGLILACAPGEEVDSGTSTPPTSSLWATTLRVTGAFGYDPEVGMAVPYHSGGARTPALGPWLELAIQLDDEDSLPGPCRINLRGSANETPVAAWVDGEVRFGLDWAWEKATTEDTCPDLDPERYPSTLPDLASEWTFGLGVLPLADEVLPSIEEDVSQREGQIEWDTVWADNVVGGAAAWDALEETWTGGWALGFAVDEDMSLVGPESGGEGPPPPPHDPSFLLPLSREVIEAADTLPRGVYLVDSLVEFDASLLVP